MDARQFILTQIDEACRQLSLSDVGSPSWADGQFIRACTLRLDRADSSAWPEFVQRLKSNRNLAFAVRSILIDRSIVHEARETGEITLKLPADAKQLSVKDEEQFRDSLNLYYEPVFQFADPRVHYFPDNPDLYKTGNPKKFMPPSNESRGEIMYIEMKPGLAGSARIGRVQFSKTRKTIYYAGKKLQSLKGSGYKANYFNVESGMWYWVSRCRKDGNDALYPNSVEIDEDVREEYWTEIRNQPENKHLCQFRSPGKYSKRRPS